MRGWKITRVFASVVISAAMLTACGRGGQKVGSITNDWTGNEIVVEAVRDPDLPGVVCHMTYFDRSVIDRLRQGNWFENPSNTSITCQRIGPIDLSHVSLRGSGDEVFTHRQSLFFKKVVVRRMFDIPNRSVLYISHSRQIVQGSAKMDITSVALTDDDLATIPK